jgi:hypothetical protein
MRHLAGNIALGQHDRHLIRMIVEVVQYWTEYAGQVRRRRDTRSKASCKTVKSNNMLNVNASSSSCVAAIRFRQEGLANGV